MPMVSTFSGGGGGGGGYPTSAGWKDPRTGIAREAIAKDEPIVLERYGDIDAGETAGALTYDEVSMALISPTQQFMAVSINHAGTIIICLHSVTEYLELTFSAYMVDRETDRISFIGKYGTGYTASFADSMCIGAVEWSKDDTYFSLHHRQGGKVIVYKVDVGDSAPVFTKLDFNPTYVTAFHWSRLADNRLFYLSDSTIGANVTGASYALNKQASGRYACGVPEYEIASDNRFVSIGTIQSLDLGITDGIPSGGSDGSTYYRFFQGIFGFAMNADESGLFLICGYLNMYRRTSGGSYSQAATSDFYYSYLFGMSTSATSTLNGYGYQYADVYYYDIAKKKKLKVYSTRLAQTMLYPARMFNPDPIRYFPEQEAIWIRNGSIENGGSLWEIRKVVPNEAVDGFVTNGIIVSGPDSGDDISFVADFAFNHFRSFSVVGIGSSPKLFDIDGGARWIEKTTLNTDQTNAPNKHLCSIYSFSNDGVYLTAQIRRSNTKYWPFAYKLTPKTYVKALRDIYAMGELSHASFTEYGIGAAQETKEAGQEIRVNLFPELNNRLGGKVNR